MRYMHNGTVLGAHARMRPPNLRTVLATLAGACALLAADAPAVAGGKQQAEDSRLETRRRRWWMDGWAHSMQERCFIEWMDELVGSTLWRHSMQERDVEWNYEWWTAFVWLPPETHAAD